MGTAIGILMAGNLAISWFGTWYQGGPGPSGAAVLWGILAPIVIPEHWTRFPMLACVLAGAAGAVFGERMVPGRS